MRKLLTTTAYFFLFIIPATLAVYAVGDTLEPADFPRGSPGRRLADFDRRVRRFRAEPAPRIVVVGTCYGRQIETPGESFNISTPNSSPHELLKRIEAYCDASDHIVIPVSLADMHRASSKHPIRRLRRETYNEPLRFFALGTMSLRQRLGVKEPSPQLPELTANELQELYDAMACDELHDRSNRKIQMTAYYLRTFPRINDIPTAFFIYDQIHDRFPNAILVLFPTIQFNVDSPGSPLARSIEDFAKLSDNLRRQLIGSEIPYLDWSGTLATEHFDDAIHPNKRGIEILRAKLHDYASTI